MARHDREESLEEQLAWLDAIKETEEAPVPVSASTSPVDEPLASPYPKDPWSLVPQQQETPTPPLFRAAVDSVYGAGAAEDLPTGESEAGEWLGKTGVKEESPAPAPRADDPFLAPLKPLPRPDDTDTYALSFTPPDRVSPLDKTPPPDTAAPLDPPPDTTSSPDKAAQRDKTAQPEQTTDTPWPPSDWSSVAEPASEKAPAAEAEQEQPPEREERSAWADTQPRNERLSWAEQPESPPKDELPPWAAESPEPRDERPQWVESSETMPRTDRPQWNEPESGPQEPAQQQERSQWTDPQQERPHWAEQPEQPERLPWAEKTDRPAWAEKPDRPAWAEQPDRPQWNEQPERPQWSEPAERSERTEQPEWRPAEREIPPTPQPRRRPAPVPVFTAPSRPPITGRPTADSLDPESLLRGRRNAPSKGWRRLIYKASGGWIKPGEPPEVRRRRELVTRARTPVTAGHHRVAVLSLKGGVGKTTTTVGLGATLAQVRGDRVIAVDANPDRGTLSDKLVLETSATVRDLLNERDQVKRYVDIRAFTSQAPSRLEVLASDRDPSVSEAFSGSDYQDVSQVLENFYSICITDCGTGLLHSAMGGVLGLADQIVLVSSPSVDGARAASATLDWLEAHHYADLVKNATVVLCSVRPRSKSAVDIKKLEAHFAARCRAVVRVPYDPHLEEGAEIDLDRLQEPTRDAYLQLAAYVGDAFAGVRE
ncbi:AAA family ATPase [Nonomuraea sp. NPDC050643]|uniref:MinD/ParA family ATP-binding protein n=1 Tax=Nonomuraea sp. NPDC050643 TaxID=3155660 RepID=UPI0033D60AB5